MGKKIKKSLAVMLCVFMMVTSVPLSGFVGLELPNWSFDFSSIFNTTASAATLVMIVVVVELMLHIILIQLLAF